MASIGEAARASGVAVETIRYYERAGVVGRPLRAASGHRVYGPAEIARLTMVRRCRDLGFALADVRVLLGLAAERPAACAEVKALAEDHLAEVRRKQRDLTDLERALADLVAGCAEGRGSCLALRALAEGPAPGAAPGAARPGPGRRPR